MYIYIYIYIYIYDTSSLRVNGPSCHCVILRAGTEQTSSSRVFGTIRQ